MHQLVGQRGKGAYFWDNKMCSCSTSLSPVKSLKARLRKAGVPAKRFCVHVLAFQRQIDARFLHSMYHILRDANFELA